MLTLTRSLDSFIDEALAEVARYDERGYGVTLTTDITSTSQTTFTLDNGTRLSPTDVVEIDDEVMLVTDVTSDVVPTITVSRGYDGTTAATHAVDAGGMVNPMFSRKRVGLAVQRSFPAIEAGRIFNVRTEALYRVSGMEYAVPSQSIREVLGVGYMDQYGRFEPVVDGWRFFDDMPAPATQIIRLPRYVSDTDQLIVKYSCPFRWSSYPTTPSGSDTIEMPEGTEHLPCLYATAWLVRGREISRQDIDRSEEWNRTQGYTSGLSTSLVKQMWSEFYQARADAARLYVPEISRPYRRQRRFE